MKVHAKRERLCLWFLMKEVRRERCEEIQSHNVSHTKQCGHVKEDERKHSRQTNIKVQLATGKRSWRESGNEKREKYEKNSGP